MKFGGRIACMKKLTQQWGLLWVLITLSLVPFSAHALTEPCGQPALSASGYFFDSYESVEYSPEGNLVYHFKNQPAYSDGRAFQINWLFVNDDCETASVQGSFQSISLPAGVTDWSVRIASATSLEAWDDEHETMIASYTIPEHPSYTRIRFQARIGGGVSSLVSRTERMFTDEEPPLLEGTLEKPALCPALTSSGYYFDSYEHAEYVDGLLRVHLRLKSPFNDGRQFKSTVFSPGSTCLIEVPFIFNLNTQFPPYLRYYSFRMTSDTQWQLWDDENNAPILCTACSGTIDDESEFVSFFASIDGGASSLRTTPFPPTISVEPEVPNPVIIIPGILGSEQHNGEWVIDPILHTYDDLIATLDVNGYTPEVDLFPFPYNWRRSNVETALLLKEKIDAVKAICDCEKVDLVAHSMGGLVARQYIQSDAYEQDVDQLIFLGTPHLGAPKAYLMWEGGEFGPSLSLSSTFLEQVLGQEAKENGYEDLFTYIQNKPISSVRELLPIYDYIFDLTQIRHYPTDYPINLFLENLNEQINHLINSDIEIHNFVGNFSSANTITAITTIDSAQYLPMWPHGYPENYYSILGTHGLEWGHGDKTVPLSSASFIHQNLQIIAHAHDKLPTEVEGEIYQILTGRAAEFLSREYDSLTDKLLHIKILSPADLLVEAPDGKKVGKQNGQMVNQIPDAYYTGFNTNTEYITILNPLEGQYKIITDGTGNGAYTVETSYISEATTTEASFTGHTTPGLITELNVRINNDDPVLDILPTDVQPPVITILSPVTKDYLRSEQLLVNVTAEDQGSDIRALGTSLGTTTIPSVGTIDLFFLKLGSHTTIASSTDNVGNATTSKRTFRVIATASSTISDIDRIYSLGWMTQSVYTAISKKFKAAIKFSKFIEKKSDGKPNGVKVQVVVDKILMAAMLIELQKYRGKGLNESGYQLLREDILWLIK